MLRKGCITLFILLLSQSALANPVELKPYRAVYSNKVDATISISGEAIRELKQRDDGTWELSVEASAMMAKISESTHVTLRDNQLLPLRYDYHRRILTRNRNAQLRFDWDAGHVTTDIEDKPWRMSIEPGVHDKLSYQLQMPADIAAGQTALSYQVADGGHIQTYRFKVMGEDLVDTPAGQFNAIRVERDRGEGSDRETLIWFAPELDYIIVRLEQIEPKGDRFTLLLKQVQ